MVEKTNPSGTEPHNRATAKTLNRMRESPARQAMTSDITGNQQLQVVGGYATSDQVDDALLVIDEAGEEPWFVWLAFNAPHTPFHVPPADLTTLSVPQFAGPSLKHRAAIEAMDTEIGRLLMSIRPAVLARTWVIFVGDNGSPQATLPGIPFAKATTHEFGIHVPLLVAGPRVHGPGREDDVLVGVTDLYATICDMVRVPTPPEAVDSISFYQHLRDLHAIPRRTTVYAEMFSPNGLPPYVMHDRALRDEQYKLREFDPVFSPNSPFSFFQLTMDPFEDQDLLPGLSPSQQSAFDSLAAELDQLEF